MAKKTNCSPNMTYLLCLIIVGLIIYLIYTNLNFGNENNKRRESFEDSTFPPSELLVKVGVAKDLLESLKDTLGKINNILVGSISDDDLEKIYKPVIDKRNELDTLLSKQINTLVDKYGVESETLTTSKVTKAQTNCLKDPIIKEIYQNAQPYYCMYVNQ